jgi:hypothetical protein
MQNGINLHGICMAQKKLLNRFIARSPLPWMTCDFSGITQAIVGLYARPFAPSVLALSLLSSVFSIRRSSAEIRIERTEIQYPNLTSPALRIS